MKRNPQHRHVRLGLAMALVSVMALFGTSCWVVGSGGPSTPHHPIGVLDAVTGGSGTVQLTGWAAEASSGLGSPAGPIGPAQIVVVINGQWQPGVFPADQPRPDVDAIWNLSPVFSKFKRAGSAYGFNVTLPAPRGPVTVCVGAVNTVYPHLIMSEQEMVARGLHITQTADHSFIGCKSSTVT